jgi:hypothetical protein
MGFSAINIDCHTIDSFLDISHDMRDGGGSSKHIKPFDSNQLDIGQESAYTCKL